MDVLRLLFVLAWRSLLAHRIKSGFVGLLLFSGTFLVVTGSALSRSVERTMETAITGSLAGHLQIYDSEAPDPLEIFGGMGMGTSDVGEVPAFEEVAAAVGQIENVASIVPMGITNATVFGRNDIDNVLEGLRNGVRDADRAEIEANVSRARSIVDGMAAESESLEVLADEQIAADASRKLERARDPAFWEAFTESDGPESKNHSASLAALDWLDGNIAPMASDGEMMYIRVIGTDPGAFEESFDKFYIVDGVAIEPGQRGFLFSKRTYETIVKNKVARELDGIYEAVAEDGKTIAGDDVLSLTVERNIKQYRRIVYQMDPGDAEKAHNELAGFLGDDQSNLEELVQAFLDVDDSNIVERHAWFYERIAPKIRLYEFPVGGTITLRSFTKSGYMRSIKVPILGTYELEGLEDAGVESASNICDLVTFRELYGKMTEAQHAELDDIRTQVAAADVSRESAEADLFGGGGDLVAEAEPSQIGVDEPADELILDVRKIDPNERYDTSELREGLVLSAAVILKDPSKLRETQAQVQEVIDREGLQLQVIDWQTAAGMTGQFIVVMRIVLFVALFIVFLVALIIINNAMVMATTDRVAEIGTMRAIGAQRFLVVALFVLETVMLGIAAGGLGAVVGVGVILFCGSVGIPAGADIMVMLYAGTALYPSVDHVDVGFGMAIVIGVAVLSTLYPAVLAAGVRPVVAMQGKE